jgi:hypothetical protein
LKRQPLSKSNVRALWSAMPRFGSPTPSLSDAGPTSVGDVVWAPAVRARERRPSSVMLAG